VLTYKGPAVDEVTGSKPEVEVEVADSGLAEFFGFVATPVQRQSTTIMDPVNEPEAPVPPGSRRARQLGSAARRPSR